MSRDEEIVQLLTDIRDGQREALARQHEQLELARHEAERMRRIADESVALRGLSTPAAARSSTMHT